MKTWQAILVNIGLIFGSSYLGAIKDEALKTAVAGTVAAFGAYAAKVNSCSDQNGNKLPPPAK